MVYFSHLYVFRSPCLNITYYIIVCMEVNGYKIVRYACKFTCTQICVHMNSYGKWEIKSSVVWRGLKNHACSKWVRPGTKPAPMSMSYLYPPLGRTRTPITCHLLFYSIDSLCDINKHHLIISM